VLLGVVRNVKVLVAAATGANAAEIERKRSRYSVRTELVCIVCQKREKTKGSKTPLHGMCGWSFVKGGSLTCSNECTDTWDQREAPRLVK
jgi:hypothetical protein